MTGPHSEAEDSGTRPISVAELLAKNGTIGAPAVTRRRRRRRGDNDAVTVAELTGDLPAIGDDDEPGYDANQATDTIDAVEPALPEPAGDESNAPYWSEPEPRWPKSPPQPERTSAPERSEYPRPLPEAGPVGSSGSGTGEPGSGAEDMTFDPMDHYADAPVDVMDSDVREAEPALEDSAYVRSFLRSGDFDDDEDGSGPLPAAVLGEDEHLDLEDGHADTDPDAYVEEGRFDAVWRGGLVVLQSMLAVAFGGGLFVAFDQLWRWNSLVALVLSVLVILGLVAGVRVVRKTEDIASTLIAVAVGALITLGPLALSLQSG
ncbi:hypothetical protein [Mycobacterium sp. E2479]|uniref:hypothetical protein n=1 Tax=Mycobacterium sp. E2479 TaxID=1834134 RepID=UPI0008007F4C|nr:hypothetical protein [Mycobacterium sp. E2479]OBH56472.1 hypothetical protein A5686_04430 [Mycobacterium sp. E2479]